MSTSTRPAPQLAPSRDYAGQLDLTVWTSEAMSTVVRLTPAELQALLDQAHDELDMTAQPFRTTAVSR